MISKVQPKNTKLIYIQERGATPDLSRNTLLRCTETLTQWVYRVLTLNFLNTFTFNVKSFASSDVTTQVVIQCDLLEVGLVVLRIKCIAILATRTWSRMLVVFFFTFFKVLPFFPFCFQSWDKERCIISLKS